MNDVITKGRERQILFSGPLVRAILGGTKTQTRRLVKPQPGENHHLPGDVYLAHFVDGPGLAVNAPRAGGYEVCALACPFGEPGDRLWVRETWRPRIAHSCGAGHCDCADVIVTYAADGAEVVVSEYENRPGFDEWTMPVAAARGNVPGIHMPRWASRILLEITEVRVERLQAITEEDARAEGIAAADTLADCDHARRSCEEIGCMGPGYRAPFARLWDSINGERAAWSSNPWVWAITFRRVQP